MKLLQIEQQKLENDRKLIEMAKERDLIIAANRAERERVKQNRSLARSDSGTSLVSIATSLNEFTQNNNESNTSNYTTQKRVFKGVTQDGRKLYEIISSKIIEVDENNTQTNEIMNVQHSRNNSNVIIASNERRRSSGSAKNQIRASSMNFPNNNNNVQQMTQQQSQSMKVRAPIQPAPVHPSQVLFDNNYQVLGYQLDGTPIIGPILKRQ